MQRFIDNGDNTITDTKTNLIWTKTTVAKDVDFDDAEQAVATLGEGWRLPTLDELQTIVDRKRYNPAINTDAFPDTKSDWYWTSDELAADPAYAWFVDFSGGLVGGYHRDYYHGAFVRAVRSPGQ